MKAYYGCVILAVGIMLLVLKEGVLTMRQVIGTLMVIGASALLGLFLDGIGRG